MPDYSDEEQRLAEAMRSAGYSADDVARTLARLSGDISSTSTSFRDLRGTTRHLTGAFSNLASGNAGLSSFGNSIGGAISSLGNLVKAAGPLGIVLKGITTVLGEGTQLFANQLDASLKSYQAFSQVGFSGARGLTEFRDAFVEARVPQEMFTKMITQNARALTALYTSSSEAAQGFATNMNIFKGVEGPGLDYALRNLGFTTEDVADSFALYADIQRRTGAQTMGDQVMLRQGTIELSKELELAARLTGDSRKEQEAALKRAMENARYQAAMRKMEQTDPAAAARVRSLVMQTATRFPTLSKAIQDTATGFLNSPEAKRMQLTTGNLMQTVDALKAGTIDTGTALGNLQTGAQRMENQVTSLAMAVGDDASIYAPFSEFTDFISIAQGDLAKAVVDNKNTIDDVFAKGLTAKGQDSITTEVTQSVKNLEAASASVQGIFLNFETISGGLQKLTEVAKDMAEEAYAITRSNLEPSKAFSDTDVAIKEAQLNVDQIKGIVEITDPEAVIFSDIIQTPERMKALSAGENVLKKLKEQKATQPMTIGQFLGSDRLAQDFQDKFKLSADTILSPNQLNMLRPMIKREKGFFGGDIFPESNWKAIEGFIQQEFPKLEVPKFNDGSGNDMNNFINDLNAKMDKANETNERILSAINDGNKVNKDQFRYTRSTV